MESGRAPTSAPGRTSPAIAPVSRRRRGAPRRSGVQRLSAGSQVGGIVPTWQLFRTATAWRIAAASRSRFPRPTNGRTWSRRFATSVIMLFQRSARSSRFRSPQPVAQRLRRRRARERAHARFRGRPGAVEADRPRDADADASAPPIRSTARPYNAGLGFYAYLRFHIDSTKYRRWNMDPAVAAECPPIVHPEDVASVGQPLPAQSQSPRQSPAVAPGSARVFTAAPPQTRKRPPANR